MENYFIYSILTYVHSELLEEKLNIGILFYFPSSNRVIFKHPKTFNRIKELYSDFSEWQLKTYVNAIAEKVVNFNNEINLLNKELFAEDVSQKIITDEILKKDATVLRFSELKKATLYTEDNKIVNDYYNLYFAMHHIDEGIKEKHDEEYIKKTFTRKLTDKSAGIHNLFKRDIEIRSPDTSLNFDYEWRNGIENLVKPIAFDLEDEVTINNKAVLYHGKLSFLADKVKNYNIDFLLSRPLGRGKKLNNAYIKAKDILNRIEIRKSIVEEDNIDAYIAKVVKEIKPPVA